MALEHEKAQMLKDFHTQKEIVISEHEKEMDNLKETHQNELYELKCRVQEKQDKDTKVRRYLTRDFQNNYMYGYFCIFCRKMYINMYEKHSYR